MIDEKEIRYNCNGLVGAWMDIHKSEINEDSELSLTYNGETTKYNNSQELSDGLMNHIILNHKGTIDFSIDGVKKESFDIL